MVNEQMREFLEKEKRLCLTKPFALAELRNVIKSVLKDVTGLQKNP
ncbi:MAG TPA: hypothetical protein VN516_10995 [Candidatus Baltobacteraceae bacterium]|nr:hypothetical protein [Candidatus Baltobacteraceae bacterium]